MKKYILYIVLLAFSATSCDVLDIDPVNKYSETTAWQNLSNLDSYVKGFYGILYSESTSEIRGTNLTDGYTDLVKYTRYGMPESYHNRFLGVPNYLTADNTTLLSPWDDMYKRIRQVNEYFEDLNSGRGSHLDQELLKNRTGEVRFLRAFAYQELVARHGGVVLRVREDRVDDHNDRNKARSSEADCWDFVIEEYKKAAALLPEKWDVSNTGRATQGAAWGLMARAALYAGRWDDAIAACEEVEKLAAKGNYELLANYADVFSKKNNKELILTVNFELKKLQHNFDLNFTPTGDGAGICGGIAAPTDEFAGSFDIKIGDDWKKFDWAEVISKGLNPWTNRDPRFYQTILYNGADWKGRKLELFVNGKDGYLQYAEAGNDAMRKSVTGYAFRKFITENLTEDFTFTLSDQFWIEMRYAEIFLIKSEAYARKNKFTEAYSFLNKLRTTRTTVQLPELPQKGDWDSYLTDLQKERICELGLEGHRYFDLCRWGIASKVLNKSRAHAVKITKSDDNSFKYERVECDVRDRLFPEKYQVVPIPTNEIKNNALCEQDVIWK